MSKQNVKIIITEAINFLAAKYATTPAEIVTELEAGHMKLTESFSSLIKAGLEVA